VTAAAERLIDSHIERRALAPFLVSGTVRGQSVVKAVRSPAEVLDEIVRWCEEDPQATGNWRLRHDYSEPITIIARFRRGLVRETRRIAHLFRVAPGIPLGHALTAHCGETLPLVDTEWLTVGAGMPCESCLSLASREICRGEH
jgi:hypothetical protein